MNAKTSSERMAEAMRQTRKHWEKQRQQESASLTSLTPPPPAPPPLAIALSREPGAEATTIARAVGGRLGFLVYDRELVQRIADDMGVHASLLESVDEKQVNWFQECINAWTLGSRVSDYAYRHRLMETLLALAAHGDCIIVGRGAAQFLSPATTLRVRLVSPLKERIAAVSQRFGVSPREAAHRIETTDQDRNRFVREYFGKDATDPAEYDLVLNTAHFSQSECADLIVKALGCLRERLACPAGAVP